MAERTVLMVFRRDLRLQDNTALLAALAAAERVVPCFVFDDRQVGKGNAYRSGAAVQFMVESLAELDDALRAHGSRLHCLEGVADKEIPKLAKAIAADAVYFNKDYTPFSRKRDEALATALGDAGIACRGYDDALLTLPGSVHKDDGLPYTVYTAFAGKARKQTVARPQELRHVDRLVKIVQPSVMSLDDVAPRVVQHGRDGIPAGGRKAGLHLLGRIADMRDYADARNIPSRDGTTRLSPHHKFGTISVRETYWAVRDAWGGTHTLLSELYWRDFFTHIGWHFPHVFGGAFRAQYDNLLWSHADVRFTAWCEGRTGFPIVDAGMRQMRATGWMHNRVRMIVASFLVKDLHIDWRKGEQFFATQLVDYDPAVNNGNWQWAASTGCDAQPYFRIFNPWEQQKKFDPDGVYIKKWIPELADIAPKQLHKPEADRGTAYPQPIVDHATERLKALAAFTALR